MNDKEKVVEKLKGKSILDLKEVLANKTSCTIQHTGWCCGTCFFAIDDKHTLTNADWQTLLHFRGDSKVKELDNLPPPNKREKILEKIMRLCRE